MTNTQHLKTDVLVVGGGTAGTMAAIKAKQANPEAEVFSFRKSQYSAQRGDRHGHGWG